ncbi:Uncharacterised protein [Mycobacteroides abscessus subsp. bolletii]|nr:Uncharacterised protein [Mycobacteroides abscessus subsp. bolletii]
MRGKMRMRPSRAVIAAVCVVAGFLTSCQSSEDKAATAKSDCQTVNELLAYDMDNAKSAMNGVNVNETEATARMQGYADKISDPNLKSKAQQLVDLWKASAVGGGSASNDLATFVKQQAALANQSRVLTRELERLCPSQDQGRTNHVGTK